MWLSKRSGSISKSIDTGINVGSDNRSNLGKDTEVNIDSKIGTESQNWRSGSHSCSSSISLKLKLVNLLIVDIGQVQDGVMKLNLN